MKNIQLTGKEMKQLKYHLGRCPFVEFEEGLNLAIESKLIYGKAIGYEMHIYDLDLSRNEDKQKSRKEIYNENLKSGFLNSSAPFGKFGNTTFNK